MNNIWQLTISPQVSFEPMTKVKSSIGDSIQLAIENLWNNWLTEHPRVDFFLSHPWLTGILLIIVILTIWGIIQKLPSFFVNFWVVVFKSPFILGKSLLKNKEENEEKTIEPLSVNLTSIAEHDENLKTIVTRLEQITQQQTLIQREQKQILERLKKLEKEIR